MTSAFATRRCGRCSTAEVPPGGPSETRRRTAERRGSALFETLKTRARRLEAETLALYLAARHPATPWFAKVLAAAVAAYALSPIDLIPDFIPVLGYLDDLVLVPAGIAVAVRLVPAHVLAECRVQAAEALAGGRPVSKVAAAIVVTVWLAAAALLAFLLWRVLAR